MINHTKGMLWNRWIASARAWLLRRCALRSKNEMRRLDAACKLNDQKILKQMALEATVPAIRSQAAALVENQAFLTAIALNAWDIEQGQVVVNRITHDLLLRRVVRSARQDAIRLAAARILKDIASQKQIARSTADITLCWEVACELKDPELLAAVALYKSSSPQFEPLRYKARNALRIVLEDLGRQRNENALITFILLQPHLPFKLYAFFCLEEKHIGRPLLQYMACQSYHFISPNMIRRMVTKIKLAGWQVRGEVKRLACHQCQGRGVLSWKIICAGQASYHSEAGTCAECGGSGRLSYFVAHCTDAHGRKVDFRLPPTQDFAIVLD